MLLMEEDLRYTLNTDGMPEGASQLHAGMEDDCVMNAVEIKFETVKCSKKPAQLEVWSKEKTKTTTLSRHLQN
jgi:hypothetical protein